jgi:hypothetical protein
MYKDINTSIPTTKLKKIAKGHTVSLTASDLKEGPKHLKVHHLTHKKMMNARKNNKGCRITLSQPEVHESGSLWDDIKGGLSSVGNWLKDSGVGSALADAGQQALTPIIGDKAAQIGRKVFKSLSGVGIKQGKTKTKTKAPKKTVSSEEMKARMARVRSFKKNNKAHASGSFLLR